MRMECDCCWDSPKYIIHSLVTYDICIACRTTSRDWFLYYINAINSLWPSYHITPENVININWSNAELLSSKSLKTNPSKISNYKHFLLIKCTLNVVWKMVAILFRPERAYEMRHICLIYMQVPESNPDLKGRQMDALPLGPFSSYTSHHISCIVTLLSSPVRLNGVHYPNERHVNLHQLAQWTPVFCWRHPISNMVI